MTRAVTVIRRDDELPEQSVTVVIDVIRAFTTAAVAFGAGATEILCAGSPSEARALRAGHPGTPVMGEQGGIAPPDFDYGNSPAQLAKANLAGRTLIQTTSNGTYGLARARGTLAVLAAAAVNTGATARWIAAHHPEAPVSILCTGGTPEDRACAAYLRRLLAGRRATRAARFTLVTGVRAGGIVHRLHYLTKPSAGRVDLAADIPFCASVDSHPFAMIGHVSPGAVHLRAVPC